jgi:uncharacterized protein
MNVHSNFNRSVLFIFISSIGGFLLSLTGLKIGWILGTIIMATILSFRQPKWLTLSSKKGLSPYWLKIGQMLLAIQLGQQINLAVLQMFKENWLTITIMLVLSVFFSLVSGFILWKFSQSDMLTSFFATAPGGIVVMPSLAEDVGANTAVVSIIQTMRVFLVVLIVPILASSWVSPSDTLTTPIISTAIDRQFEMTHLLGTILLGFASWGGYYVGKFLKLPAPILVGGMLGVAVTQSTYQWITGSELIFWWPATIMILSQILIASSIGSRFQKNMFNNLVKTVLIAFISTIGLIIAMLICAYFVSEITGISLITSILAFAPGGVAEMAATSVILGADSTFVVAVQVLRIVAVILILPPLFRFLHQRKQRKNIDLNRSASSHAKEL